MFIPFCRAAAVAISTLALGSLAACGAPPPAGEGSDAVAESASAATSASYVRLETIASKTPCSRLEMITSSPRKRSSKASGLSARSIVQPALVASPSRSQMSDTAAMSAGLLTKRCTRSPLATAAVTRLAQSPTSRLYPA